jgi:hypothetical protein
MKLAVSWVVAPCSLVEFYQRFRGTFCLHHQCDRPSTRLHGATTQKTAILIAQGGLHAPQSRSGYSRGHKENPCLCQELNPVTLLTVSYGGRRPAPGYRCSDCKHNTCR